MKYLAMVVLNPNISKRKIDFIQGGIVSLFEQKSRVNKTYFLGKRKLEYPVKKFEEGYHLKLAMLFSISSLTMRHKKIHYLF